MSEVRRVFAVTGGFGVLGTAVAQALDGAGATVALIDRADAPAAAPAGAVLAGGVDMAESAEARAVMARIVREAGRLDGLVNVAGGFAWEILAGGALETWDAMYRLNLRSAVSACQAALPHLAAAGGGRIVNVGALGAVKAGAGMGAYAASKAGIAKLTEALAEECKDRGITVNAVLPSLIDTPRNRRDLPDADFSRWVAPAAVAAVIAFLLSDAARAVTGALLPVSGRI